MTSNADERASAVGDSTSSLVEECYCDVSEATAGADNSDISRVIDVDILEVGKVHNDVAICTPEPIPCVRVTARTHID